MENILNEIKFDNNGLIPVVVQDYKSDEVLMLAYMNKETLEKTLETGKMTYWSRSRQKIWIKGETSGHFQFVKSIKFDCDGDTLLAKVEQIEAACHTGHYSCFYREIDGSKIREVKYKAFDPEDKKDNLSISPLSKEVEEKSRILQEVYDVIIDRMANPKEGSYTNYLFDKGLDKILKKVGEETSEVIIAAKNKNKDELRYEVSDLLYHLFVLLAERGVSLDDIYNELKHRR
jgi:phosphoribosyl-ATP pyrophosphohydrolase/phosphoribosyl-AMP cyclohydrolase